MSRHPVMREIADMVLSAILLGLVALAAILFCGWAFGGEVSACPALDSPRHKMLDALAQGHAEYMARVMQQGHQGFEWRYKAARAATGCRHVAEICAESWPRQSECSGPELWREAVKCWRQSPGHWVVARVRHQFVGAGLAKGNNGIWYMCIIASN